MFLGGRWLRFGQGETTVDFARVLTEVGRFLDRERARFGLAGAVALNAHGLARATTDLDLVVEEKVQPASRPVLGTARLHLPRQPNRGSALRAGDAGATPG